MARCSLQKTLMICIVKGISLGTNTYAVSRLLPSQYSLENKIGKRRHFPLFPLFAMSKRRPWQEKRNLELGGGGGYYCLSRRGKWGIFHFFIGLSEKHIGQPDTLGLYTQDRPRLGAANREISTLGTPAGAFRHFRYKVVV